MDTLFLIYIILFYSIAIVLRTYILYKRTGINAMKIKRDHTPQGFNANIFSIVTLSIPAITFLYLWGGSTYQYLSPISYLHGNFQLQTAGLMVSVISLIWIFAAQMQMQDSWRIGIEETEKTELIARGLFKISRNPIFLGVLLAAIGFFLFIPSALSLCVAVVSYVSISFQIRLEEQYLENTHGQQYLDYKKKVRRWI